MSKIDEKAAELAALKQELGVIEMDVMTEGYTLAQAIRDGAKVTGHEQAGWGDGNNTCALHAGVIAARQRNCL
jgi:hypothetical protein